MRGNFSLAPMHLILSKRAQQARRRTHILLIQTALLAVPRLPGHAFPMADPVSSGRGPSVRTVPDGDTRERMVCPDCGFIAYENPKIVVGSVVVSDDRF